MQQHEWEQVKAIFSESRLRNGAERSAYLADACGGHAALRAEVEELLIAYDEADEFLADGDEESACDSPDSLEDASPKTNERRIGRYRLLDRLGEGGFGTVFRAEQTVPIRRQVALKLVRSGLDSQRIVARFEAERQALAMMEHPNIARVIDGGTTDTNSPYFVMELIEGSPITTCADRLRLSLDHRLRLFLDVCGAVQHAHQKGIIHRDLKPSNVLVSDQSGAITPKVIDFGVAKALQARISDSTLTTHQQIIGTPAYMSPEQAAGAPQGVDTRTDVYSLGVLLYELLTGVTPFESGALLNAGVGEMIRIIQQVEPIRPSTRISRLGGESSSAAAIPTPQAPQGDGSSIMSADAIASVRGTDTATLRRRLSGDLDWIVMRCLEKDANRRYPSAAALADDVDRHLRDEPVLARPPSRTYRVRKFARRNRGIVIASSLLVVALAVGTVVSTLAYLRADRARVRAQDAEKSAETVTTYLSEMLGSASPDELGRNATLREVLDLQKDKLSSEFADQPLIEARLQMTIGNTYSTLGLFEEGAPHLRRAVELRTKSLGRENEDTMDALQRLAANLRARSLDDEAEPLLREAVEVQTRLLGPDAKKTLTATYELAVLLRVMKKYDEAESIARDLVDRCRVKLGQADKFTLEARQNLAALYNAHGQRDKARSLLEETIGIQTKTLGADHPDTLLSRFDFAIQSCGEGLHQEAAAMYPELIAAHERTLGENHRMTLAVRSYYAAELGHVGRLDEADKLVGKVLPAQRALLSDSHRDVLESMQFAADIKSALGQKQAELALREKLLETYEKYRGPEDSGTLNATLNLGAILFEVGDLKRSEEFHRKALAGYRKWFGPAADMTFTSTVHLINLLQTEKRYDEEAGLIDRALKDLRTERPELDAGVQELLHRQGHLFQATGRMEEALTAYRTSYEAQRDVIGDLPQIKNYAGCYTSALVSARDFQPAADVYIEWIDSIRKQSPDDTLEIAGLLDRFAYCLIEAGRLEDGEARAREAADIREKLKPDDEKGLAGSRMLMATSLTRQKRFANAEPMLRDVLAMRKRVFGPDHWLVHNTESVLGECLMEERKLDEARELLESSYKALAADPAVLPLRVKEASARLDRLRTTPEPGAATPP